MQRIPPLLNEVHRLIEEHGVRFALLGSSARKALMRAQVLNMSGFARESKHPPTDNAYGTFLTLVGSISARSSCAALGATMD